MYLNKLQDNIRTNLDRYSPSIDNRRPQDFDLFRIIMKLVCIIYIGTLNPSPRGGKGAATATATATATTIIVKIPLYARF